MPRIVYVIPTGADVADYLERAQEEGADEVVVGIPPAWSAELLEGDLPTVYVEDDPEPGPPAPPVLDPLAALEARLVAQEARVDALLLAGIEDGGGTLEDNLDDLLDLPDDGGSLDDLDDLLLPGGDLADSGQSLDDLVNGK